VGTGGIEEVLLTPLGGMGGKEEAHFRSLWYEFTPHWKRGRENRSSVRPAGENAWHGEVSVE